MLGLAAYCAPATLPLNDPLACWFAGTCVRSVTGVPHTIYLATMFVFHMASVAKAVCKSSDLSLLPSIAVVCLAWAARVQTLPLYTDALVSGIVSGIVCVCV